MKFKKNIVSTIFWRGLYFLTVLLLNIIVSRYFAATGSGWIYYTINFFSLVILIASLSLESGMIFFASGNIISPNKLAPFALLWSMFVSIIIVGLLFFYYHDPGNNITPKQFIFFSFTYTAGYLLSTFFNALFYANQDFELPNLLLTIINVILILSVPVIIFFLRKEAASVLLLHVYFLNFLLQGVVLALVYCMKNNIFLDWVLPQGADLKQLFRYSFFALFANIFFFLLYRVDYWFVKNNCAVCNAGDLGNYIQVSKLGQVLLVLPSMIAGILFPRTAAGFNEEVNTLLPLLSRAILFLYLLLMIFFALTGYWLFPFVYGATFYHMYVPFLLLMPGILALSLLAFISAYYAGKNKVIVNLKASSLALAVVLCGDIFFIPYFGIKAAALASSAAYLTCYAYVLMVFNSEHHVQLKDFFVPAKGDFIKLRALVMKQFKGI